MSGRSVFRPPTPEPEPSSESGSEGENGLPIPKKLNPEDRPLSVQELVEIKFLKTGKKDRLMELLRRRLVESGWRDKLKIECRAYIKKAGRDNLSVKDLVRYITPKGRAMVPALVKAELLQEIQVFLQP